MTHIPTRETVERQTDWYHQIVIYLLKHAEHLPVAVEDLIREATNKRRLEYGTQPTGNDAIEEDEPSEKTDLIE